MTVIENERGPLQRLLPDLQTNNGFDAASATVTAPNKTIQNVRTQSRIAFYGQGALNSTIDFEIEGWSRISAETPDLWIPTTIIAGSVELGTEAANIGGQAIVFGDHITLADSEGLQNPSDILEIYATLTNIAWLGFNALDFEEIKINARVGSATNWGAVCSGW